MQCFQNAVQENRGVLIGLADESAKAVTTGKCDCHEKDRETKSRRCHCDHARHEEKNNWFKSLGFEHSDFTSRLHDPQLSGDRTASPHYKDEVGEERSKLPCDDEHQQLPECLRLAKFSGPNTQLGDDRDAHQHRQDQDKTNRLHTEEIALLRKNTPHRAPPMCGLNAEEEGCTEH